MLGESPPARMRVRFAIFLTWLLTVGALAFSAWGAGLNNISGIMALAGEYPPFRLGAFLRSGLAHGAGIIHLGIILLAVYGAGRPVGAWIGIGRSGGRALKMAFGWGAVSMLGQGMGLAGIAYSPVLAGAIILLSAAAVRLRRIGLAQLREFPAVPKLPAAIIGVVIAALFIQTRFPDTFEDSMLYHFAAPEQWLMLHKIFGEPLNVFWNIPLACETIYLFPWNFGGIEMAKLVNFGMLLTILGLVFGYFRVMTPGLGRHAWWASLWLVSAVIWIDFCWQGKNDVGAVLFFAAAALCAVRGIEGKSGSTFAIGWFLGQALAAKMTAVFPVAGLFLAYIAVNWKKGLMPVAAYIGAAAMIPLGGWLLQSWIFVGNPLYPFFPDIFPSLHWGADYLEGIRKCMATFADPRTSRAAEVLAGVWSVFGSNGSAALIGLLPLAFLVGSGRTGLCLKLGMAIAYFLWVFTERNGRYLAPLLPLAAVLAALAAARLEDKYPAWIRGTNRFLAVACLAFFGMRVLGRVDPEKWYYLAGNSDRARFMREIYTTWEKTRLWVNANIHPSARVVALCEPRRLWFNCRVSSHAPVYQSPFWRLTREARTPHEVRKRVKQLGYSHCIFNFVSAFYRGTLWFPGPEWSPRQLALYEEFMALYARVEYMSGAVDNRNGGYYVYSYLPVPALEPVQVHYLPSAEGMVARVARMMRMGGSNFNIQREFMRLQAVMPRAMFWKDIRSLYLWERNDFEGIRSLLGPVLDAGYLGESTWRVYAGAALNLNRFQQAIVGLSQAWRVNALPEVTYSLGLAYLGRAGERAAKGNWEGALNDAAAAMMLIKDKPRESLTEMDIVYKSHAREVAAKIALAASAVSRKSPGAARALASLQWVISGRASSGSAGRKE